MSFSGKLISGLFFAMAAMLLMIGCDGGSGQASGQKGPGGKGGPGGPPQLKSVAVAVKNVARGQAKSVYSTTATLEAEHHAEIRVRTNGVALNLFAEEGDFVETDQVLMKIEDNDQQVNLKQAELALAQAEHEFKRSLKLREAGILPDEQFDQKKNSRDTAEAQLEEARLALTYTKVTAPFAGRIVRRHVQLGANVQSGNIVYEIMDVDPLLAKVHIPANRLNRVTVGQGLELALDSTGETLEGVVSLISPIVDPTTGTVKVTVEVKNYPEGTRPGDFTRVNVVTDLHDNAMLVPSIAVFEEQGRNVLFVAKDGKAVRRVVSLGFVESGVTEVTTGLEDGEAVVVKGQRNLRDGVPLEILEGSGSENAQAVAKGEQSATVEGVGQ